jgi:hypothetical protein
MNPDKKQARKERNRLAKQEKAAARQANLALVGKLVFEKEVDGKKVLDFPPVIRTSADGSILPLPEHRHPSFARSVFVNGKTFKNSYISMKNRPGNSILHAEAIVEDASRAFAKEVDKILNPPKVEETVIPVIPENAAIEAAQL